MGFFDFLNKKKITTMQAEIDNLKRQADYVEIKKQMEQKITFETDVFPRVFEIDGSWQYEILHGGLPMIRQDCYPGKEGFTPMTQEDAERLSNEIVDRLRGVEHGDSEQ